MAAEVSWPVRAGVRSVARAPDVAGVYAVRFGGGVAHLLERVAAVAEVARPVCQGLELDGLHLGAVLGAFEVSHLRDDPVDGAVEPGDLAVQHVDEAPQQRFALVGELRPLDGDARHDDADGLGERLGGVVLVPDVAAVELTALGASAEEGEALADGGGRRSDRGCDCIEHIEFLTVHPPGPCAPS